jgi:hypothetical protein
MYNMVFGSNPLVPAYLKILMDTGVDRTKLGRLRDLWVEKLDDGTLRFAVHTRNGGGNREHYADDGIEAGPNCNCTGCLITYVIPKMPGYISDKDEEMDCTYATIYFKVPEDINTRLKDMGAPEDVTIDKLAVPPVDMSKRWNAAIEAIKTMK